MATAYVQRLDKCCPCRRLSIFFFRFPARLAVNQPEFQQCREFRCPLFVTRSAGRQLVRFRRERSEASRESGLRNVRGFAAQLRWSISQEQPI